MMLGASVALPASAAQFSDVPDSHSLSIEIDYLAHKKMINGYPDGRFQPNAPVAKKHIAKMLVDALDLPTTNLNNPGYQDVPITHPYYKDIAAAYKAGIFSKATYFKPESSISRAFMAKILAYSFNLKSIAKNAVTYRDVATTSEFYRPIQLVTMNNVAQGYHEATQVNFKPTQLLTRAHFAAFLARALSLQAGNYTANTNYKYYYEDDTTRNRMQYVSTKIVNGDVETWWNVFEEGSTQPAMPFVYINSLHWWLGDFVAGDVMTNTKKPFTIGLKYDDLASASELNPYASKQRILATDATVTIAQNSYSDVVIIEDTISMLGQVVTYIAKDIGVIAYGDTAGNFYYWLDERIVQP